MEPGNNFSPAGNFWRCQKCGEANSASDGFCRRCGSPAVVLGGMEASAPKKKVGAVLWVLAVLILLAGLAVAGYFVYGYQQKKVAVNFLTQEGKSFANSIKMVNDLSSDKNLEDKDNNPDLFLKKLEDEKIKSEKAYQAMKSAEETNKKNPVNKMVAGVDALLKQYYKDGIDRTNTYDQYIGYRVEFAKEDVNFKKELDKLDAQFKNIASQDELVGALKGQRKLLADEIARYNGIKSPSGLEEAHQKRVDLLTKMDAIFGDIINAIETKNKEKFVSAFLSLDDMMNDTKTFQDIKQLEEFYFDSLHGKFTNLRESADNLKSEMIRLGTELRLNVVSNLSIEGW